MLCATLERDNTTVLICDVDWASPSRERNTGILQTRSPDSVRCTNTSTVTRKHRLRLNNVGEPLWHFKDAEELLDAITSVVEAHKLLYEHGYVHRDICPGSIRLESSTNTLSGSASDEPRRAFVMDVDYARLNLDVSAPPATSRNDEAPPIPARKKPRDSTMIGTVQFQARQVLKAIELGPTHKLVQNVHHDIESITLVIAFAVLRYLEIRFQADTTQGVDSEDVENVQGGARSADNGDYYWPSDDEDSENIIEKSLVHKWIKQSYTRAFGQKSIESILVARTVGYAFHLEVEHIPDEIHTYYDTPDGATLRDLLLGLLKDLQTEEHFAVILAQETSGGAPPRTQAARAAARAVRMAKRDENYRLIYSHETLLKTIQRARKVLEVWIEAEARPSDVVEINR